MIFQDLSEPLPLDWLLFLSLFVARARKYMHLCSTFLKIKSFIRPYWCFHLIFRKTDFSFFLLNLSHIISRLHSTQRNLVLKDPENCRRECPIIALLYLTFHIQQTQSNNTDTQPSTVKQFLPTFSLLPPSFFIVELICILTEHANVTHTYSLPSELHFVFIVQVILDLRLTSSPCADILLVIWIIWSL